EGLGASARTGAEGPGGERVARQRRRALSGSRQRPRSDRERGPRSHPAPSESGWGRGGRSHAGSGRPRCRRGRGASIEHDGVVSIHARHLVAALPGEGDVDDPPFLAQAPGKQPSRFLVILNEKDAHTWPYLTRGEWHGR